MTGLHVKIAEVNAENRTACCELELSEEQQQYMEPNAVSIAQSTFEPALKPFAIYSGETVVGFLMYNSIQEELDAHWIYRIMIGKQFQGKGIGKKATSLLLKEMAASITGKKVAVGYRPENQAAHHLYASLGFIDNQDRFGKEMAVTKLLT